MSVLKIRVQSVKDAEKGEPLVEGLKPEDLKETEDITIAILEKGTARGQTTFMFLLKNNDGTTSMAQITASHFTMLCGAFVGAEQRFEAERAVKN